MKWVRMYSFNERMWHWVQAITIVILLLTGAEIHSPEALHLFGFSLAVSIHNAAALFLLLNAALGLFFFLTSGLIRQYVPGEHEFTNLAIEQIKYYMHGIFRGQPHPIQHGPGNRLNPLQKITYLVILNLLLPTQVISGVLLWAGGRWPELLDPLGGLSILVPIHVLSAWFFLAFIVMHIYLTTTGKTPLANIKAMIVGVVPEDESGREEPEEGSDS